MNNTYGRETQDMSILFDSDFSEVLVTEFLEGGKLFHTFLFNAKL